MDDAGFGLMDGISDAAALFASVANRTPPDDLRGATEDRARSPIALGSAAPSLGLKGVDVIQGRHGDAVSAHGLDSELRTDALSEAARRNQVVMRSFWVVRTG